MTGLTIWRTWALMAIVRQLVELHGGIVDAESAGVGKRATLP